jgi:hypothetical protein
LDKVRLALILITLAITLGPIGGIVALNLNNPLALVIPPNLSEILRGSFFTNGSPQLPTPGGAQYDAASRTVSLTFNFKNFFKFDMKINSMTADVECAFDNFPLGKATLKNPVTVRAGETTLITIACTWTDAAINHFQTQPVHSGQQETDVNLVGLVIDMDGMTIQMSEPVRVAHVPFLNEG